MAKLKNLTVEGDVTGLGFIDLVYPVGSIYISVNPTNPGELFGVGEWEEFAKGKTLVGVDAEQSEFSTEEKTGGNKSVELRALIGAYNNSIPCIGYRASNPIPNSMSEANKYNMLLSANTNSSVSNINHTTVVKDSNGNDPSLLQPFITCYIWKRVA